MDYLIEKHSRFAPAPKIAFRSVGGQVAIVKPYEGRFITLNETGSLVWNNLEKGDAEFLVSSVVREFNVSFDTAFIDVKTFLHKLLMNEMILPLTDP
jgi:hypothetical protein